MADDRDATIRELVLRLGDEVRGLDKDLTAAATALGTVEREIGGDHGLRAKHATVMSHIAKLGERCAVMETRVSTVEVAAENQVGALASMRTELQHALDQSAAAVAKSDGIENHDTKAARLAALKVSGTTVAGGGAGILALVALMLAKGRELLDLLGKILGGG